MKATLSVHDRYQVELKVDYSLPDDARSSVYELDLYVFTPQNLGVNPQTYTKHQFYTDLQAHIRLKTPLIPLNRLAEDEHGPLHGLRTTCEAIAHEPTKQPPADYEKQIKLFCCLAKSAVRNAAAFIQNTPNSEDRRRLIGQYVDSARALTKGYRDLRPIIQTPGVGQRTLDLYYFGDEYLSLLVEDHTSHLSETVSSLESPPDTEEKQQLLQLVLDESQYRLSRRYPSIPNRETDNETLVFRRSVLKKYVASILYLRTEVKKAGQLLEQALFGLTAALAMVFATAVAFISQSIYGALTLPVFVALVVSYVFKDRIKDILKYYWSRRITRRLFDHTTRIHDAARNTVGKCRESFEFIADSKVPQEIHQLRDRQHITEIENGWMGEQILLYRKRVRLYPKRVKRIFSNYDIEGLNDIIRFNIREFLRKMDDPEKELFVMDEDDLLPIEGTRVYHLNLILKLEHNGPCTCTRHRLILTRKGIRRIEEVHMS